MVTKETKCCWKCAQGTFSLDKEHLNLVLNP